MTGRSTWIAIWTALVGTLLTCAGAVAMCRTMPFEFSPLQNDQRTALVFCDARGGRLSLGMGLNRVTGANVEFTSAKVLRHPGKGRLVDGDGFSYTYTPRSGYTGNDSYVISICARSGATQGCSTLTFDVTVQ